MNEIRDLYAADDDWKGACKVKLSFVVQFRVPQHGWTF